MPSEVTSLEAGEVFQATLQDPHTDEFLRQDGSWGAEQAWDFTYSAAHALWYIDFPDASLTDDTVYLVTSDGITGGARSTYPLSVQPRYMTVAEGDAPLGGEIARYLDAAGLGTFDETGPSGDIYVDHMPDTVDSGICVYASGGPPPDVSTSVSRPAVQIIVRGNRSAQEARATAASILAALHGLHDTTFITGGTRVMLCAARQSEPIPLGRDENGRGQYSINFQLITGGD